MPKYASLLRGFGVGISILAGAMIANRAQAQAETAEAAPIERVEVTGSNIRRAEVEQAQNVQVITTTQIQQSGQETVSDYLRNVISSTFGNNSNEQFANSFAPGSASVGLRGLTQKDTLVLLNGQRITQYGFFQNLSDSFVDLNVIPLSAVDRIEVLKSGGSAIYGSDAIAGVINIILKQNTTEKTATAGGRITTQGGATTRDASLLYGLGDFQAQGYNLTTSISAYRRDQLLFSERDNTKNQDYRNLPDGTFAWQLGNQYRPITGVAPRAPFPTCGTNGLPGTVTAAGTSGLGCYYNQANYLPLSPAADRANATAIGNLKLNDNWTAFVDVFYSFEKTTSNFTPVTLSPSSYLFNPATSGITPVSNILPASNPSARIVGGVPVATPISFNFLSVGGRDADVVSNTFRVSGGFKGNLMGWDVDGAYGHSENHVSLADSNGVNGPVLQREIADGSFSFLNPLSTPAALNALRLNYGNEAVAKLDTLGVKGTGPIYDLPAGPLSAAVGVEFRHESVDDEAGEALRSGHVLSNGVTTVIASRDIEALFAEFDVPILKSLEADLAGRWEHYEGTGSNFSPQLTLRYQPIREFTLRAVGSHGFRAPSLAESSRSTSVANQTVVDPHDPLMRPSEAVGYITGGNPDVQPETSKNLDIGIIVSPVKNLNFTLDWYSIWLYSIISPNATAQAIILNPSAYPPGSLVRAADGTVIYAKALYENQFGLRTSGVDFETDYTLPLPDASKLKFEIDATYVSTFLVNSGFGVWSSYVGSNGWDYLSPISGGGPVPRWKGLASTTWSNSQWTAQVTARFFDRYDNSGGGPNGFAGLAQENVSSFTAIDLYGEFRYNKHWKASLTVVNVADRNPPYDSANLRFGVIGTPYDLFTYDDFGRMIDLHVAYSF
ncbi:MAG TPA: TonB-dependent receptor [Burkholderiaceae bacterium]|jgi:iron complex outermembrane receptor protein|nr:TonB-dependent receptor [Burkholderiaceae bacterium]